MKKIVLISLAFILAAFTAIEVNAQSSATADVLVRAQPSLSVVNTTGLEINIFPGVLEAGEQTDLTVGTDGSETVNAGDENSFDFISQPQFELDAEAGSRVTVDVTGEDVEFDGGNITITFNPIITDQAPAGDVITFGVGFDIVFNDEVGTNIDGYQSEEAVEVTVAYESFGD